MIKEKETEETKQNSLHQQLKLNLKSNKNDNKEQKL